MHIFLIRHGESRANTGENADARLPDHLISLTEKGVAQADAGGQFLAEYIKEHNIDLSHARIWRSPYLRTRQTSEEFNKYLNIDSIREDITLVEQRFGLFDSIPKKEWITVNAQAFDEYLRYKQNQGKFYARLPMGESPYDVAVRIHQFMGSIRRDYEKEGIDTIFVFTHGTALRAFLLRWFHYSPEWYEAESNPKNCWIREIDGKEDKGYIYCPGKEKG